MSRAGAALVVLMVLAAIAAPVVAPHGVDDRFPSLLSAPPTRPHVRDAAGGWHAPFIYRTRLVNRLEQTFEVDRSATVPLAWFTRGRLVVSSDDGTAPLLLLGADSLGRDVFSRLLAGARVSLALAGVAALGTLTLGLVTGGLAGYAGGLTDEALMRAADFVMVLPAMYVALALRSALPLVLAPALVFWLLAAIFAVVGAPFVARGVRAIVRSEREREYVEAARSLGAGHARLLGRHLLPAARGFLLVQLTIFVPAFIVAEATLSYVGLGFPDPVASWGTMLRDAANIRTFADFPWLLSPAAAIFLVVLGLNLLSERHRRAFPERPL